MSKDPAVMFYVPNFIIGSALMTPVQKGHYITLLCYQQQSETGSLSLEEIKAIMKPDFDKQWPAIKKKFKEDSNGFYNERMRLEMNKRIKFSKKQSENAKLGWQNRGNTKENTKNINGIESGLASGNAMAMPLSKLNTQYSKEKGVQGEKQIPMNGTETYDAEKTILENQIEFERICMVSGKKPKDAKVSLHKYHLHLEEKEQYPRGKKAAFAGFEKWLLNERKFKLPEIDQPETGDSGLPKRLKNLNQQ